MVCLGGALREVNDLEGAWLIYAQELTKKSQILEIAFGFGGMAKEDLSSLIDQGDSVKELTRKREEDGSARSWYLENSILGDSHRRPTAVLDTK
jgi:hypothetical protein